MTWTQVATLDELKIKQRLVIDLEGQKILILLHQEKPHAVAAKCPHLGLPLSGAAINKNEEIVCPYHKSTFSLCSGEVKCWAPWPKMLSGVMGKLSKPKTLKVFPLKLEKNNIMLQLD